MAGDAGVGDEEVRRRLGHGDGDEIAGTDLAVDVGAVGVVKRIRARPRARRNRRDGVKLSQPEAVALIADEMMSASPMITAPSTIPSAVF